MRYFHIGGQAYSIDGEAVIVRGDFNTAGRKVFYWLIPAAMAEFHLVGRAAQRRAEQLVAETNPENRSFRLRELSYLLDDGLHCAWIAGPIR